MITKVLSHVMTMLVTGLYIVEMVSITCISSKDHRLTDLSKEANFLKKGLKFLIRKSFYQNITNTSNQYSVI
jgi:hypothetical protein